MRFCLTESLTYDVYMQGSILRVVGPIYPNLARSDKDLKFDCSRLGSRPLDNYQFQTSGQDLAPSLAAWEADLPQNNHQRKVLQAVRFAVRLSVRLMARFAVRLSVRLAVRAVA